jgi:CMP-N-acetylneuraminic acid synthetase
MSNGKVTAYYPVKKDSERVPGKNLRLFNGRPLFTIMLHTLAESAAVDSIVVDTDSPEVEAYVRTHIPKAVVVDRAPHLLGPEVQMNALLEHFLHTTPGEHFLQTHATNPLLKKETVNAAVQRYFDSLTEHDSLFSANRFQNRFYDHCGVPLNHSLSLMERTQDMQPVYEENSCLFIFSRSSFAANGNSRIGKKPLLFETSKAESLDIDWEDDFLLAELIGRNR